MDESGRWKFVESGNGQTVPFKHKLWWFQIPQVLLQRARHSRSTPFAGVGLATSTGHPLSGAFPAAPAAAPQRRAGAQAREHQARPDLRPRQGECCKSSRGNYYLLSCWDKLVKLACNEEDRPPPHNGCWWISLFESKGISFERKFSKGLLLFSRREYSCPLATITSFPLFQCFSPQIL